MVVAVGITSDEVRSLASQAPAFRAARGSVLKSLVVSGDAVLRGRLGTMSELGGFSACDMPADASDFRSVIDGDYQLVIVDIARPLGDRVSDTVEIAEEFAGRPGTIGTRVGNLALQACDLLLVEEVRQILKPVTHIDWF